MKTPEEIIASNIMWAKAKGTECNHALAKKALADLDAAGYVIVPKEPTGAQRQLFREMMQAGDDFTKIYPAILNEWTP